MEQNIIYLCLDMVKLEDLDYINNTLDTTSFKGIKLTNVLRSMSRPADLNENIKDKINFLQKLVGLCKYGNKFSKRIKLDFELAYKVAKRKFNRNFNINLKIYQFPF